MEEPNRRSDCDPWHGDSQWKDPTGGQTVTPGTVMVNERMYPTCSQTVADPWHADGQWKDPASGQTVTPGTVAINGRTQQVVKL